MENQKQTVIIKSTKSVGVAILLTIFFGPLGMLYSTISGGIIMLFVNIAAVFFTLGLGLIITWPICVIWAAVAANNYNRSLGVQ